MQDYGWPIVYLTEQELRAEENGRTSMTGKVRPLRGISEGQVYLMYKPGTTKLTMLIIRMSRGALPISQGMGKRIVKVNNQNII